MYDVVTITGYITPHNMSYETNWRAGYLLTSSPVGIIAQNYG